jgi:MscS family membrane protein
MKASSDWIRLLPDHEFIREALLTALVIIVTWSVAQLYLLVVNRVIGRVAARDALALDTRIWRVVRTPGAVLIVLIGIYGAIHRYSFRLLSFLDAVLFALGVVTVLFTATRMIGVVLDWYGEKISREHEGETISRELLPLVDKVLKIVVIGVGLIIVLDRYGIKIESILLTFGVGSLAVGLALQDTLANMFGGFTIMLDHPFCMGDYIQLPSGEQGEVKSIGMRTTAVVMPNGSVLVIPNAQLVKNMVINCTQETSSRVAARADIVPEGDVGLAKKLMAAAAADHPRVLREPAPAVFFESMTDGALRLILYCRVARFADVAGATDDIHTAIVSRFRQAGIELAVPNRTVVAITADSAPRGKLTHGQE